MTDPTAPNDEPIEPVEPVEPAGLPGSESWTDAPPVFVPPMEHEVPSPAPEGVSRYDSRVVLWSAVITTVLAGVLSVLLVLVPIMLIVAAFLTFLSKDRRTRSIWMGILIGCGLGLLVFAGVCAAILSSSGSA